MITLSGNNGLIQIDVMETVLESRPDFGFMKWHVYVDARGFTGGHDSVWVLPTVFEQFVADLEILEQRRSGRATLSSASPEELELTLSNLDHAGHMIITGQLGRHIYVRDSSHTLKMLFAFELEPTRLNSLIREFADLRVWA